MKKYNTKLNLDRPRVMSIINVTPDSFYDSSRKNSAEAIYNAVEMAIEEGSDVIDIGGYSSRPGAADVDVAEEIRRLSLGLECVRRVDPTIPISIDTFRGDVARFVLENYGDCIINDISAGEIDSTIIDVAAEYNVPYIAMHMRAEPKTMQQHTQYTDVVSDVKEYFRLKLIELRSRGVEDIIIDPGFGFAKDIGQNFQLIDGLSSLRELGSHILVGVSRKSMIYKTLDTTPEDSLIGTAALHWQLLLSGASILRVHDTKAAVQVIKLFNEYKKSQNR